jgi:hypothetical protein
MHQVNATSATTKRNALMINNILAGLRMVFSFTFPWADFDFLSGRDAFFQPSVRGELTDIAD